MATPNANDSVPRYQAHQQRQQRIRDVGAGRSSSLVWPCSARSDSWACRYRGGRHITRRKDLQKLPEAALYRPRSIIVSIRRQDYDKGILGVLDTACYQALGTDTPDTVVAAFYDQEFSRRGWTKIGASQCTDTASRQGTSWQKGQVILGFSLCDAADMPPEYSRYRTIYRINIFAIPMPTPTTVR